jgi:hypothetical protein
MTILWQVSAYGAQPLPTLLLCGQKHCCRTEESLRMEALEKPVFGPCTVVRTLIG